MTTPKAAANSERPRDRAKRRVFVDMDGVVVDFDAYKTARGLTGDEVKAQVGAYLGMQAIPGAIEAVRSVIGMGYEVWMATKPPTGVPHAYSDKAAWVLQHLPELKRRIIVTHDKGLLGCERDFLLDDRPHKANCERFAGTLLRFVDGYHWPEALRDLRAASELDAQPTATERDLGEARDADDRFAMMGFWIALNDANDLCRSAYQVIKRCADGDFQSTNWASLRDRMAESLKRQHNVLYVNGKLALPLICEDERELTAHDHERIEEWHKKFAAIAAQRKEGECMNTESMSLAEALQAEMARVRDELLPLYDEIPAGVYAAAMMRRDLDAAAKAAMEGDTVAMLRCYERLREYEA